MGQLDIDGGGAVLVFAGYGPHIHAYLYIIYYHICQYIKFNSHAYMILAFQKCLC
jgi:hypothetical protein